MVKAVKTNCPSIQYVERDGEIVGLLEHRHECWRAFAGNERREFIGSFFASKRKALKAIDQATQEELCAVGSYEPY